MRIIFMGTPEFAVLCLERIVQQGHEILSVFTQPDKLFGRKRVLKCSPVKIKAESFNFTIKQPEKLDEEQINFVCKLRPDVIVVVAYGKIIPKAMLQIPRFGCVNIHASLLPRHRGASPIQTSIACGDEVTGVSAIFLNEKLDSGDIIGEISTKIEENETAVDLFSRLSVLAADLICEVLPSLEKQTFKRVVQNDAEATYTSMLTKNSGRIDFKKSARWVHRLVCGMVPWPVAFCCLKEGKVLKIHRSCCLSGCFNLKPGEVSKKGGFVVGCGCGTAVEFLEVQLESRKKMDGASFLNGFNLRGKFLF